MPLEDFIFLSCCESYEVVVIAFYDINASFVLFAEYNKCVY